MYACDGSLMGRCNIGSGWFIGLLNERNVLRVSSGSACISSTRARL
jgi:hypothetical protein